MFTPLRFELGSRLKARPELYLYLARRKYGSAKTCPKTDPDAGLVVCPGTNLVLEGFPRSGNTFACKAFLMAQKNETSLAHHLHAPGQIIAASNMHVPTLVIVREPLHSVSSLLLREPGITPGQALGGWIRFHASIAPFHHNFVTATFDQITTDFGAVTHRINTRFHTSFERFAHTPDHVLSVFRDIERGATRENEVARPSATRNEEKAAVLALLAHPRFTAKRHKAEHLYSRFSDWAGKNVQET